jgi:putative tributyrin esterase
MAQIQCNFFSYSLGHGVDVSITLPSFTSCNMKEPHTHRLPAKFPVLYLLHGAGNDYMVWHRYTSIDRYAEEKRIAVVTCSVGNSAYANVDPGENYYDFLNRELPEFVESYFPISDKREERYIAGLSMGGYGSLLHGLQNPERYSAIGAFSPAVFRKEDLEKRAKDGRPSLLCDIYEVTKKALESGKQLPDLFLCIGDQDFLYEPVTAYHQFLEQVWTASSRLRYDDLPGYAHEFSIWDLEVVQFLDWITRKDAFYAMGANKV